MPNTLRKVITCSNIKCIQYINGKNVSLSFNQKARFVVDELRLLRSSCYFLGIFERI